MEIRVDNLQVHEQYIEHVVLDNEGFPSGPLPVHPGIGLVQQELNAEMVKVRKHFGQDEGDWFMLTVHDYDTFGTDGILFDILVWGESDFGYGASLGRRVDDKLAERGYFLEQVGSGVFRVVSI